jgi:hypothetical protein
MGRAGMGWSAGLVGARSARRCQLDVGKPWMAGTWPAMTIAGPAMTSVGPAVTSVGPAMVRGAVGHGAPGAACRLAVLGSGPAVLGSAA